MSHDRFIEQIHNSRPVDQVAAAINDDPYGAGIITEHCPDALVASRLFNVATAAMDMLRREPQAPLIEIPIDLPDPEDWLERFTFRILNDSINRPSYNKSPQLTSGYVEKLGICTLNEEKFLEAALDINRDPEIDEEPGTLLIDNLGRPVFYKKQNGQPTTIAFKALQINKVRYPAGTILNLVETNDMDTVVQNKLRISYLDASHIEAVAPLRFSQFSFKPEVRTEAMTPIEGYEIDVDGEMDITSKTASDITKFFPDAKTLRRIYSELKQR
jgi:hypothetical protein